MTEINMSFEGIRTNGAEVIIAYKSLDLVITTPTEKDAKKVATLLLNADNLEDDLQEIFIKAMKENLEKTSTTADSP